MEEEKLRILVVEDEPDSRVLISRILSSRYEVSVSNSAPEAMESLPEKDPHIVLTDIRMPGQYDGLVLLKKIKETNPGILVIIVTGYGDKSTAIEAIRGGAFDFIEKPFRHEQLKYVLERASKFRKLQIENQKQQMELVAASRLSALGEMSAGIAHEINNPLTVIEGRAVLVRKILEDDSYQNTQVKKHLEHIESGVMRIAKIIAGLRSFSRKSEMDPFRPESIQSIISKALELSRDRIKTRGVDVTCINSEDFNIDCRESQIGQVLINLLNNALDAVVDLDDKWIELKARRQSDQVKITVTDSGSGIPKPLLDKLMTPFFTTKPVGQGTGLGLSISRGIVEDHSGELTVDSDCPNTRFVISLPLHRSQA